MKIKEVKQVIDKFKKKMKEKKDKKKRLSAIPPKPKTEKTDEALFSAFFIAFKNVLAIVELDENCSFADVKRAYKKMCRKYHPDRHMELAESDRQEREDMFKSYKEVYDLIIENWPYIEEVQQSKQSS
jgi:hypothetical protein